MQRISDNRFSNRSFHQATTDSQRDDTNTTMMQRIIDYLHSASDRVQNIFRAICRSNISQEGRSFEKRSSFYFSAFHQLHHHQHHYHHHDPRACRAQRVPYFAWPSVRYSSICMCIDAKQGNECIGCVPREEKWQAGGPGRRVNGKQAGRQGRQAGR